MKSYFLIIDGIVILILLAKFILYIGFKEIENCYLLADISIIFLLTYTLILKLELSKQVKENFRLSYFKEQVIRILNLKYNPGKEEWSKNE